MICCHTSSFSSGTNSMVLLIEKLQSVVSQKIVINMNGKKGIVGVLLLPLCEVCAASSALQCLLLLSCPVLHTPAFLLLLVTTKTKGACTLHMHRERGKGEGPGEGGGSLGILGEGPGVVDLQRSWGCHEGIRTTWKVGPWHTYFKKGSGAGFWSIQSGCDPSWRRVTGRKRRISANLA